MAGTKQTWTINVRLWGFVPQPGLLRHGVRNTSLRSRPHWEQFAAKQRWRFAPQPDVYRPGLFRAGYSPSRRSTVASSLSPDTLRGTLRGMDRGSFFSNSLALVSLSALTVPAFAQLAPETPRAVLGAKMPALSPDGKKLGVRVARRYLAGKLGRRRGAAADGQRRIRRLPRVLARRKVAGVQLAAKWELGHLRRSRRGRRRDPPDHLLRRPRDRHRLVARRQEAALRRPARYAPALDLRDRTLDRKIYEAFRRLFRNERPDVLCRWQNDCLRAREPLVSLAPAPLLWLRGAAAMDHRRENREANDDSRR